MAFADKLKGIKVQLPKTTPLWDGPESDTKNGGVTQGLIGRWLGCPERFRCYAIEGLRPRDTFNSRLEFGTMWHLLEETFTRVGHDKEAEWSEATREYCQKTLCEKYPFQREEISHWYDIACALFPVYIEYWSKHPDVQTGRPLLQEEMFNVSYQLASGRTIRLRGKWDSVDYVEGGENVGIWLQENKTKSQIDQVKLTRQLTFDLQTMTYLTALTVWRSTTQTFEHAVPVRGVRYNCVRRSAHKLADSMMQKVGLDMRNGRSGEWLARWNVEVSSKDIERFRRVCLDPILENMLDDYEWLSHCKTQVGIEGQQFNWMNRRKWFPNHVPRVFVYPFGIYNPLEEGGGTDLDEFILTGSEVGLHRTDTLFPELSSESNPELEDTK